MRCWHYPSSLLVLLQLHLLPPATSSSIQQHTPQQHSPQGHFAPSPLYLQPSSQEAGSSHTCCCPLPAPRCWENFSPSSSFGYSYSPDCAFASSTYLSYDFYFGATTLAAAANQSFYQFEGDIRNCFSFSACSGTARHSICQSVMTAMPCYPPPLPPPPPRPPSPPLPPFPPTCERPVQLVHNAPAELLPAVYHRLGARYSFSPPCLLRRTGGRGGR